MKLLRLCLALALGVAALQPGDSRATGAQTTTPVPARRASDGGLSRPAQGRGGAAAGGTHSLPPTPVEPDPLVWEMIDQITTDEIYEYLRQFSGEEPVWVDGDWYTIPTRYTYSGMPIEKTTHYLGERLAAHGLDVEYHVWNDDTNPNVIGQVAGLVNPDDIYLIGGHIDSLSGTPGADDNASGAIAALIAAQVMAQYQWGCTLRFAMWTGEEQWLLGSHAYAQRAWLNGENILGHLNAEMIAWNSGGSRPGMFLHYDADVPSTLQMAQLFEGVVDAYDIDLEPYLGTSMAYWASDHMSFWEYGYPAIMVAEDWVYDFNPNYHQASDTPANTDAAYLTEMVKASVATFAHMSGCLMPAGLGRLDGHVTAADGGAPIAGAAVTAENEAGHGLAAPADGAGYYTLALPAGPYTVTAEAYGYLPVTASGVAVVTDTLTTQDFALPAAPYHAVSGRVIQEGTGAPLLAHIEFAGSPVAVWTDPADGSYQASLAAGRYTMLVRSGRHLPQERAIVVSDGGQVQEFSLEEAACVLLVDDDQDAPDVRPYYTQALDAIGAGYDVWDVAAGAAPDLATLQAHRSVIWFLGGSWHFTLTSTDEWTLADYLDGGGNLLLVGQDYFYEAGLTPFGRGYLHVADWLNNVGQTVVAGRALYAGLGPYSLSYPFENGSDRVIPDLRSAPAFEGDQGNAAVSFVGAFRTVFLGFPFEALPPAGRLAVLQRTLEHFRGCEPDTGWLAGQVTDAGSGEPIGGAHVTVVPSSRGQIEGLTDPNGHYTFTLPADTYGVTAGKEGYAPKTVGGVEVQVGETAVQDLALEALCSPVDEPAFTWLPAEPRAGDEVTFTGTATGTLPISFDWAFGDGTVGSGATTAHIYGQGGVFAVTMTATNECGQDAVQQVISVRPGFTVYIPIGLRER